MKALILAGGHGTRLRPASTAVNKHLLPVYDKPMIMYGIEALRDALVTDIYVSISTFNPFGFLDLLRSGRDLGVHLSFLVQEEVKGIAWAINEAEPWLKGEPFIVYLADNIFTSSIKPHVDKFYENPEKPMVLLKRVDKPEEARRYGVARFSPSLPCKERLELNSAYKVEVTEFVEKPAEPPSQYVLLGVYFLTPRFFDVFPTLKPSQRGEYEITDALNQLMPVDYEVITGDWWDCGEFGDILRASFKVSGWTYLE